MPYDFLTWPALLLGLDASIKGLGHEILSTLGQQAIALSLCGRRVF